MTRTDALEEVAGYAVEQFHEEAKGKRGWDPYHGECYTGHAAAVALVRS
jgi:hypothetical protein